MRLLITVLVLAACGQPQPAPTNAAAEECYLNAFYVSDSELSLRVWQHIQNRQHDLIDDRAFAAALWYNRSAGRAGFIYRLDCQPARQRVQAVLEQFAQSAPSPDVAEALCESKTGSYPAAARRRGSFQFGRTQWHV